MDERELVARCKSGDDRAFRLLYDRYASWMMGISMRYTGDTESSKDILHDSFVKILVSFKRFEYRGVGSLKAWIEDTIFIVMRITVMCVTINIYIAFFEGIKQI